MNVKPEYNPDNISHFYIWHAMAYEMTKEDFEEIQKALTTREEDHDRIEKSDVMWHTFDKDMVQPRNVPEYVKEKAHKYVDWNCAFDICMILSKYAKFYSNLD